MKIPMLPPGSNQIINGGEIYRMIANQNVPDAGFEELTIYANIEKLALMKVATRPELFPCS